MSKTRVVTGLLSAVFLLTVFSSARADSLHSDMFLEKLVYAENHNLTVLGDQSAGTDYLYAGHFENNNGKHLGFSMTSVQRGPRFGIVKPLSPDSATPNPEPTAMVLLGTGLAAVAALARKRSRYRRL
jgi:PEP-CTERM motif-containing protein